MNAQILYIVGIHLIVMYGNHETSWAGFGFRQLCDCLLCCRILLCPLALLASGSAPYQREAIRDNIVDT